MILECPEGLFGPGCSLRFVVKTRIASFNTMIMVLHRCPSHNCSNKGKCSIEDGTCLCYANWTGTACNESLQLDAVTSSVQASSVVRTVFPTSSPACDHMCSSTLFPDTSPVSGCDHLSKVQGSHCDTGALAIFVLCIFLTTSVILHIFFCLRLKVDSQQERKHPRRFRIVMQESSSDFDT